MTEPTSACRYCGFEASRQSDEDCPAKPTEPTTPTPGPWEASRDAVPEWHVQQTVYGANDERVATVFEREANVTLIAAAPDLLEAARVMREWVGSIRPMPVAELEAMLDAAITRAEGGNR